MRVVSLLPSTTEILFAVGAGEDVVGVTFECDHPAEARERRVVSSTSMPAGLSPGEIDAFVRAAVAAGEDLYRLDAGALADLDADLVVTQDLCAVCAVDVDTVDDALAHLGCRAAVLSVDPRTLAEVLGSVQRVGDAVGRGEQAARLVDDARTRLDVVRREVGALPTPRVAVLEWTDPPYAPGHWLPDLVTAAGAVPVLGSSGGHSVRITWDAVAAAEPDVVVVAPCGYGLDDAVATARDLLPRLPAGARVLAADANAAWTRPALRLVDAVEDLASALHPTVTLGSGATIAQVR